MVMVERKMDVYIYAWLNGCVEVKNAWMDKRRDT